MLGERIGSYEILEEIGKGGMATVYRARQASVDRDVAVKAIRRAVAAGPSVSIFTPLSTMPSRVACEPYP